MLTKRLAGAAPDHVARFGGSRTGTLDVTWVTDLS